MLTSVVQTDHTMLEELAVHRRDNTGFLAKSAKGEGLLLRLTLVLLRKVE